MKLTKTIALISVAASSLAFSATDVGVTNFVGGNTENSLLIRDNAGNLLPNGTGSVSVGYFASLADDSFQGVDEFDTLKNDFQSFASAIATFGSPVNGLFSNQLSGGTVDAASPFVNETIYVIIGNATTLAASTELAIYKSGETFREEVPGNPGSETVNLLGPVPPSESILLGATGAGEDFGNNLVFNQSIVLASTIPEPSTGLLSLIAGLGLLARRRR